MLGNASLLTMSCFLCTHLLHRQQNPQLRITHESISNQLKTRAAAYHTPQTGADSSFLDLSHRPSLNNQKDTTRQQDRYNAHPKATLERCGVTPRKRMLMVYSIWCRPFTAAQSPVIDTMTVNTEAASTGLSCLPSIIWSPLARNSQ
jgi:hypothetical protein